jgi:hypothetical protein
LTPVFRIFERGIPKNRLRGHGHHFMPLLALYFAKRRCILFLDINRDSFFGIGESTMNLLKKVSLFGLGIIVSGGSIFASNMVFSSNPAKTVSAGEDTFGYSRVYFDLSWDNVDIYQTKLTSDTSYTSFLLSGSETDLIADFISSDGKFVLDYSVASSLTDLLQVYFHQSSAYWHPYSSSRDTTDDLKWSTLNNYIYGTMASGLVYKISDATYSHQYGDLTNKWFTYSFTSIGQFLTFDANGGTLPSGLDSTIEADGTSYTLPSAASRTDYVFSGWLYNGTVYAAGSSITLNSSAFNVKAVWTPTTASTFADYFLYETSSCDSSGVSENISNSQWTTLGATFSSLVSAEQATLTSASANSSGTNIQKFAARYDYMVTKYGTMVYTNFAGRTIEGLSAQNISVDSQPNGENIVIGVLILSTLAIAGAYVFTRKKHVA